MKSKLENARSNFSSLEEIIICPICSNVLNVNENSLKCVLNHTYNINKKGVLSLSEPLKDKLYNQEMFESRNIILNSGIYDPIFECLNSLIGTDAIVLDAGCGEGSYLNKIYKKGNKQIGLDLSKEGLNIASQYTNSSWILADLANIPIKNQSVDYILNILSPANYEQFNRVLKKDGKLIKVIVNRDYLKELREHTSQSKHDNSDVLELLRNNFDVKSEKTMKYTTKIKPEHRTHLFKMTPMTKHRELEEEISEITIDLTIVEAVKR